VSGGKSPRYEIVEKLGYLDELEKTMPNLIEHFTAQIASMNQGQSSRANVLATKSALALSMNERLSPGCEYRKNMGYAVLSKIYHALQLDTYFQNHSQHCNVQ
jgi:hypothetical protein